MKRVLTIEDENFISELYARALRKSGYDVTAVINGQDGLEVAKTNNYDLILLDIMVPGISGIEVLKQLRDPAVIPDFKAKVIITTNLDLPEDMRHQVEAMADGYLIKSEITPKQLVEFLAHVQ